MANYIGMGETLLNYHTVRLHEMLDIWFGWYDSFPGAVCHGRTQEEAIAAAPSQLHNHFQWLRTHGCLITSQKEPSNWEPQILESIPTEGSAFEKPFQNDDSSSELDAATDVDYLMKLLGCSFADLTVAVDSSGDFAAATRPKPYNSIAHRLDWLWCQEFMLVVVAIAPHFRAVRLHQMVSDIVIGRIDSDNTSEVPGSTRGRNANFEIEFSRLKYVRRSLTSAINLWVGDARSLTSIWDHRPVTLPQILKYILWYERCITVILSEYREFSVQYEIFSVESFISSLDERLFEATEMAHWIAIVGDIIEKVSPNETDAELLRLLSDLRRKYNVDDRTTVRMHEIIAEIYRLRGTKFFLDTSVLGRKYRALNALVCAAMAQNKFERIESITVALELLINERVPEQSVVAAIKYYLHKPTGDPF